MMTKNRSIDESVGFTMVSATLLLTTMFTDVAAAQVTEEWVARYNGPGSGGDVAIAIDVFHNVYVTGSEYVSGPTNFDYATIKYDVDGKEIWTAHYNGSENGMDEAVGLATDGVGNVYVTGSSEGSGTGFDYTTIKYSARGRELWVVRYNGPGNGNDFARGIAVDQSGNVYVTGMSTGLGLNQNFTTIKYDRHGNELWVAHYDGPGADYDDARAVAVDRAGNVYVTGICTGLELNWDYATIKYDIHGNETWTARYNGPRNSVDEALALAIDTRGNVYVTGGSQGFGTADDYATIKYDASGNETWVARYDGPGHDSDRALDLAVDGVGNVYVTGFSFGSGTSLDYATLKYDSGGNEAWVARYNGPGNGSDVAFALALDGRSVYVTGKSSGRDTDDDYATIKYDARGNEIWAARYNGPGNYTDEAHSIMVGHEGNVYVTGASVGVGSSLDFATIKYKQVSKGDSSLQPQRRLPR